MGRVSLLLLLPLVLRVLEQSVQGSDQKKVCGQTVTGGRILGGQETTLTRWPWQASLKYKTHHWCGATLIHSSWVMTAAHCFQNQAQDPRVWKVQLGSRTIRPHKLSFSYLYSRRVKEIILHPFYFGWPPKDIALVKLHSPIRFKRNILPICLPTSLTEFENVTRCWVTVQHSCHYMMWPPYHCSPAGTGGQIGITKTCHCRARHKEDLRKPWYLQEVELPLIDQETCDLYYHMGTQLPPFISRIYDDMICAGFAEGQKDACQGDSGGPLACKVNGIWHQAGIVSWGDGCGRPYRPSVFTNVSMHTDWILNTINSSTFSLIPSRFFLLLTLQLP